MAQRGKVAAYRKRGGLTPKEAKLVEGISKGRTPIEAAKAAYNVANDNSAAVTASIVLNKPHVREAVEAALDKYGITPETAILPVAEALTDEELEMRLKGSDRALKLMGAYQYDQPMMPQIHFHNHQSDQRERYGI